MQQTTWEKEDRQPALQRLSPAQDQGEQRLAVNAFLTEHWGSTVMMVRGEQGRLSLHANHVSVEWVAKLFTSRDRVSIK